MKYQDNVSKKTVNAHYVGARPGTNLQDALNPEDDGYGHLRHSKHIGTVLQDDQGENPTPAEED